MYLCKYAVINTTGMCIYRCPYSAKSVISISYNIHKNTTPYKATYLIITRQYQSDTLECYYVVSP